MILSFSFIFVFRRLHTLTHRMVIDIEWCVRVRKRWDYFFFYVKHNINLTEAARQNTCCIFTWPFVSSMWFSRLNTCGMFLFNQNIKCFGVLIEFFFSCMCVRIPNGSGERKHKFFFLRQMFWHFWMGQTNLINLNSPPSRRSCFHFNRTKMFKTVIYKIFHR